MSKGQVEVIEITQEAEIYPDDPNYPFPDGVKTIEQKAEYWFQKNVEEFDMFPGHPRSMWNRSGHTATAVNGIPWESVRNWSVGNSDFETYWKSCHKHRITNFKSNNADKNGFKIFREVTGIYKIKIANADVLNRQTRRIEQILNLIQQSEYGLTDPKSMKEATVPLENTEGRIEYYLVGNVSNPSIIGYDVLEAEEAPVIITDTLIESNLKGLILESYSEHNELPLAFKGKEAIFPTVMRMGESNPVFKTMRANIPQIKQFIQNILDELSALEVSELSSLADTYEVEEATFGDMGALELVSKEIPLVKLLTLKYENRNTKVQLNKWRPPVGDLKRGESWPVSDSGDYIVHITQDPLEIMFKSSNRGWANESCEALQSSYKKGCFDDFKHGNGICMVYRASDIINADGTLRMDKSKATGRFMLRWGNGTSGGRTVGPRIGVETSCYSVRADGSSQKTGSAAWINNVGAGVISIMNNKGLWDFDSISTPYRYGGYSDATGESNCVIHYSPKAFQAREGGEMGEGERVLDYNTQYDISYNEMRRLCNQDDDAILLNLAQNPLVWNYDRVIGLMMSKIYALYEESNREVLIRQLLSHEYANPELLISALDTIDVIQEDAENLGSLENNIYFMFAKHPRCSPALHERIVEDLGENAKRLYALPTTPQLSNHSLMRFDNFIFAPETIWQPFVNKLKEIGTPQLVVDDLSTITQEERNLLTSLAIGAKIENDNYVWDTPLGDFQGDLMNLTKDNLQEMAAQRGLPQTGNKSDLVERIEIFEREGLSSPTTPYSAFAQWYRPVLDAWAGHYEGAGELIQSMEDSELGIGYWGSLELAFMLMNQPNIGQENFEWLLDYFYTTIKVGESITEDGVPLPPPISNRLDNMKVGLIYLLTYSFTQPDYYGWELFNGGCPQIRKVKNHKPRTQTTLKRVLAHWYEEVIGSEVVVASTPYAESDGTLLDILHQLYTGNTNGEQLKLFFDFTMALEDEELQAKILPMLFLNSCKRSNPLKKGLALLPESAIPTVFDVMINNSFCESYYNSIFYQFVAEDYSSWVRLMNDNRLNVFTASNSIIKKKEITDEMAFNILTNANIMELIDIELLAQSLPNNEDLFYIMEDVMLTTHLEDLYNPEGDTPFRELSPEEFNDFEIIRTVTDGLPSIKDMILGFVANKNTPSEILERIIQKPRMDGKSVGYRRMFDYYDFNGNILSETESDFEENILPLVATNEAVKGRLLRYLYENYPNLREKLILNPNIVEARLFEALAKEYPLGVLKNHKISKRAYMRHLRYMMETLKLVPPNPYDLSYEGFYQIVKSVMRRNTIKDNAQKFCEAINTYDYLQFLRAGRCRFSTGLPTAEHEPTDRNLSKTGSIMEYPQLPKEENNPPFALYRGINLCNRVSKWEDAQGNARLLSMEERLKLIRTLNQGGSISMELFEGGQTNTLTKEDLNKREQYLDDEGEIHTTNNPFIPNSREMPSIYQNNNYSISTPYVSLMNIFESEYVINENDPFADNKLYKKANLKGINMEGNCERIYNNGFRNLNEHLRLNVEREALMDFIKLSPDGMEIHYDGSTSIGQLIGTVRTEEDETQIDMMGQRVDSEGAGENYRQIMDYNTPAINKLLSTKISSGLTVENFEESYLAYTDVSPLFHFFGVFLGHYFRPSHLRQGFLSIVNGEYDLEELYGYIAPENREVIRNYDSNGRFNDRLSAFELDFITTLSDVRLPTFVINENQLGNEEVVEIPAWRIELDWSNLKYIFQQMYKNSTLSYNDWMNVLPIFAEAISDETCILFPLRNPTRPTSALRELIDNSNILFGLFYSPVDYSSEVVNNTLPKKDVFAYLPYLYTLSLLSELNVQNRQLHLSPIVAFIENNGRGGIRFEKIMWKTDPSESEAEIAQELITLLIGLDMNEDGTLYDGGNTPTDAEIREYQITKYKNTVSRCAEIMGGKSIYNKYLKLLTPFMEERTGQVGRTKLNNKRANEMMIFHLWRGLVSGYIRTIQTKDNTSTLVWNDFTIMIYLLRFVAPDYLDQTEGRVSMEITESDKEMMYQIRDANLPLFIQALRFTQVREGEEFIE